MMNRIYLIILIPVLFITPSCEKFSGEQTIPAYLTIDSVYLATDYSSQGTASHRITDVWINVDNEFLGAFELPATFPVLKSGKHTVQVWPGVKKNGIAATRVSYQFYTPISREINLVPDSTSSMGKLKTTYQSSTRFTWKEDFEDVAQSLDTTSRSTALIRKTKSADSTFEGNWSWRVVLDKDHDFFECQTHNEFTIPAAPVFLEMNFNITNPVTVGVFTYGTTVLYQMPVITLNPTNGEWRKIYIDLTNGLNANLGMITYRVYLGTFKEQGLDQGILLFDNFKLVTRIPQ